MYTFYRFKQHVVECYITVKGNTTRQVKYETEKSLISDIPCIYPYFKSSGIKTMLITGQTGVGFAEFTIPGIVELLLTLELLTVCTYIL